MPAIPTLWMDSSRWHQEPLDWAAHAYQLLAPQINVKGRMALLLLLAVIWAFSWLLWRAYQVLTTPNEILVEKLGLDIPPAPLLILEEISSTEVYVTWKHAEPSSSIQEHYVELNGVIVGTTRKSEMGAVISGLRPGTKYAIRVFCVSTGTFQTPSAPFHVRTPHLPEGKEAPESVPTVRGVSVRTASISTPLAAPSMARDLSGGQPMGRRGTTGRRPSPGGHGTDAQGQDAGSRAEEEEMDDDLAELSQRFQKVQQDIEAVEAQIQEEDREFEVALKELEARRDELKQSLKERDEASNDLRKQVHKAETLSRTAHNEKTKKERLLQQKEIQRRKRKDDISRYNEATAAMKEEIAGIEKQKAAIERRTQSELREIRRKIEEEQKEVAMLEEDNKEKALQIKALEEERKLQNADEETDETREADRLDRERDMRWRARYEGLQQTYTRLWNDLQLANQQVNYTREQINQLEARRANSMAFAPIAPLDMDAVRRGVRPMRRARPTGSLGSSISSPRGPFAGPEPFPSALAQYASATTSSPTATVPSYFNPQNGMTLAMPVEMTASTHDDPDTISSIPMSPRADSLLPADLLGDESADDLPEAEIPQQRDKSETGTTPFPSIGSPILHADSGRTETPSVGSSSGRSFSSPMQTSAPAEGDEKSSNSGKKSDDPPEEDEVVQQPKKPKYTSMSSMFGLNRQRGKTLADQPPSLGSLKPSQSQSFPRNVEDFDPRLETKRRLSYGGNWAFPGSTLLNSNGTQEEKEPSVSRFAATRRAFGLGGFGKSAAASANYDPFAMRSASFDPGLRGETSSPRPSSTYSFDKMPRPSMESQFRAWNDKSALRNSPLAPDWGSLHSFSRSHSRRPSIVYGSTSNLSLPHGDEEVVEPDRKPTRPLQAPIGTRPASSQQSSTPKLNPAAPSFTTLFSRRSEKSKDKDKNKAKESKEKVNDMETASPPESRKSKDTNSIAATVSTLESDTLDRTQSGTSAQLSVENTPAKPTFISKITRKASSNKFGSWKDKGGLFSRKEASAPTGENEEEQGSTEHLGRSLESTSTTPSAEDKKTSRTSLSNWNFMRKNKKGLKEDLTASEISESSERTSEAGEVGEEREEDE
ncbi:uncharacterized protein Z520_02108 [Fonsecaea multimorphosa CBS 102226]|uniref:Fibronectin type-III domain-containing protein n=1 Tax=Fonsecaea multimorphosa CBS 102226 TaxID=1442371 RepID=A0A0D2KF31_9EURO|nr:uncharacterized protein Z520_02108 [Fonsecaea multimorphosa CBS 102226]KIY01970.1 hypothetical protein Z520_02108 [Fonsecaea multimorphosa CBS 102226]OAL29651.1 hypothetical protein AYO22_02065 [Fonsecaea multimorphosa]